MKFRLLNNENGTDDLGWTGSGMHQESGPIRYVPVPVIRQILYFTWHPAWQWSWQISVTSVVDPNPYTEESPVLGGSKSNKKHIPVPAPVTKQWGTFLKNQNTVFVLGSVPIRTRIRGKNWGKTFESTSVANPGYFVPDPDSNIFPSLIPDPDPNIFHPGSRILHKIVIKIKLPFFLLFMV
jgi:hypothetical protein